MTKKITNPKIADFIKFFQSQGVKFVDAETDEEITVENDYKQGD